METNNKTIEIKHTVRLTIKENSDISAARHAANALAERLRFNEANINRLALIVSELASNLIKHTTQNPELLLQPCTSFNRVGIEIFALDKGPGISNINQCLQDGYSTSSTSGTGLGAISRLADKFTIYSLPDLGTVVLAEVYSAAQQGNKAAWLETSGICIPKLGEEVCGDSWSSYQNQDFSLILVADGLGHGPEAAQASQLAVQVLQENVLTGPGNIVKAISTALHKTRGAAVAVAEINKAQQTVRFAGLGNINCCMLVNNKAEYLVSHNGTSGIGFFKVQEFNYPWNPQALLIMHSDGLISRWSLKAYPGLLTRPASAIASILYRDFNRGNDDLTVVVAKENTGKAN